MFVVIVTYKVSIDSIDKYLIAHREFLDKGYQENCFIASGPRIPRTGGIIISCLKNKRQLEEILNQDPFKSNNLADYEIIEFNPTKYHSLIQSLL